MREGLDTTTRRRSGETEVKINLESGLVPG